MPKPKLLPLPNLRPLLPHGIRLNGPTTRTVNPPVESGIPFFRDPGHTRPTRGLYRCLLRVTKSGSSTGQEVASTSTSIPTANVNPGLNGDRAINWAALRRNIRQEWKKRKGLTSIPQVNAFLSEQRDLLIRLDSPADELDLINLSHRLATRQTQADIRSIPLPDPKPYLAGFLRPTHFHPPLPRLKPQPLSLTLMIKKRIASRARRLEFQRYLLEIGNDIQGEMGLMRRLHEREGLDDMKGFWKEVGVMKQSVQEGYERDERRKAGVFGLGVVKRVEAGRRKRQEWKRVRAGERRMSAEAEVTATE